MRYVVVSAGALIAALAIGCGPGTMTDAGDGGTNMETGPGPDTGPGTDTGPTDTGPRDTGRPDAGPSAAGQPCMDDTMCGSSGVLTCQQTGTVNNFCTAECMNNTSQPMEQSQCGGTGSTCLSGGNEGMGFCTRACTASAMSGCGMDRVCTGLWYTRMGGPDRVGCAPFCHADAECPMGQRCSRFGTCVATLPAATNRPDGEACNPRMDMTGMPSTQCRGVCFGLSSAMPMRGICGSRIDIARPPAMAPDGAPLCPDMDDRVAPLGTMGDLLGLCIFRDCPDGCGCGPGLACQEFSTGVRRCLYPGEPMTTPVACTPGDGGTDGGTDASVPDVGLPDVGVAD